MVEASVPIMTLFSHMNINVLDHFNRVLPCKSILSFQKHIKLGFIDKCKNYFVLHCKNFVVCNAEM